MTAGLRQVVNVTRLTQAADDAIGGAIYTGTCVYERLPAQIVERMPSHAALEQGYEVSAIFDCTIPAMRFGKMVTIFERDQIALSNPRHDDPFYNKNFRVTGFRHSKRRRRGGGYIHLTLSRIDESRSDSKR
jgi:hypothetical protein